MNLILVEVGIAVAIKHGSGTSLRPDLPSRSGRAKRLEITFFMNSYQIYPRVALAVAAFFAGAVLANSITNLPLPGTDTDQDGLPDDLEIQLGSSPTVTDTDKDGFSDFVEYFAGTDPRDAKSFPLFLNSVPPRQYLLNDLLTLLPVNVTNSITFTNIVITPIDPPPTDPAEPTATTNITLYPSFATYQWSKDGAVLADQTKINLVRHNVGTNDAGLYRLSAAIDYITGFVTNSGPNEAGEITNSVVPLRALASQIGAPISVQVLPLTPQVAISQPASALVSWGNNAFKQADVPVVLTNPIVLKAVGGRAHSVALLTNGTVSVWGANDLGQLNLPAGLSNVVGIAAGLEHTLALRADGTVVAWGSNAFGQTNVPTNLTGVKSIAAGYFHSLALLTNGQVVAWGANAFKQSTVPKGLPTVVQLAAGGSHSAALTAQGRVICWGNTNQGRSTVPANLSNVALIAAGDSHTMAVRRNGDVVCWGDNSAQQCTIPGDLDKVIAIAGGDSFTAVVTAAGKVRVLGAKGALSIDSSDVVKKLPASLTNATANAVGISSGFFHLLALVSPPDSDCDNLSDLFETPLGLAINQRDTDGDGLFDGNELRLGTDPLNPDSDGDGLLDLTEITEGFDPLVGTEAPDGWLQAGPAVELDFFTLGRGDYQPQGSTNGIDWEDLNTPVAPVKGFTQLLFDPAPGTRFFRIVPPVGPEVTGRDPRAIIGNNTVWGAVDAGNRAVPNDVTGIVQFGAGDWHTVGLRFDGTVVCWGLNEDGQCSVPSGLSQITAVAGGGHHSLAVRADGQVFAWGRNDVGQSTVPTGLVAVRAISAGNDFSVALLANGTVAAWGSNLRGQVSVPANLANVRVVSAGFGHVVALREDGTVVSWGDNRFGQATVPANLAHVIAVAAGDLHSLAVLASGQVVCWGNNSVGQSTPPANLTSVVEVAGGFRHSIARLQNGSVVAWGEGDQFLQPPAWFDHATSISAGGFAIYAVKAAVDADHDNVDDAFEVTRGLNPNSADTDGDGLTDDLELQYGFNPLVADAAAEASVHRSPATKLNRFTISTGTYQLQTTTDLQTWESLGNPIINTRGFTQLLQPVSGAPERFYRLTKKLP